MSVNNTSARTTALALPETTRRRLPVEANILLILVGIALVFEILGWIFIGQSLLANPQRL
jgi:inositol transport system permease protein